VTATATPQAGPSATCTEIPRPSPSPSSTADAFPQLNLRAWPLPNPQHLHGALSFWLELSAPADTLRLRLYSPALARIAEVTLENLPPGRQMVHFPLAQLPAGLYFYRLEATRGPEKFQSKAGAVFILT
jgi:hypothetical protein